MKELAIKEEQEMLLQKEAKNITRMKATAEALEKMPNETAKELLKHTERQIVVAKSRYLGMLKAWYDVMPEDIQETLKVHHIPLNMLIKMKIDQMVYDELLKCRPVPELVSGFGFYERDSYMGNYRRFREMICGCGYNCSFIEERFREGFCGNTSYAVEGFARGYSELISLLAQGDEHYTHKSDPKEEDIWKNWKYFLKNDCVDYSIEGTYIPMYNGGAPVSFKFQRCRSGFCTEERNTGLYESLRKKVTTDDLVKLQEICDNI